MAALVDEAETAYGPVKVFCSNAGITDLRPDLASSPSEVQRIVDINLLSHVWAAQAVIRRMLRSGGGHLIQTISSAALITGPAGMGYTLTKHRALGFAEWVHLNVTCLCPNAVRTGMLGRDEDVEGPEGHRGHAGRRCRTRGLRGADAPGVNRAPRHSQFDRGDPHGGEAFEEFPVEQGSEGVVYGLPVTGNYPLKGRDVARGHVHIPQRHILARS